MSDLPDPAVLHGRIDPVRWRELHEADWPVLWCPKCQARGAHGEMYADGLPDPPRPGRPQFFEATCRQCGHAVAMPDGRLGTARNAPPARTTYTPAGATP